MQRKAVCLLVFLSFPFSCSAQLQKSRSMQMKKRPMTIAQKARATRIQQIVKSPAAARKRKLLLSQKSTAPKVYRLRKLLLQPKTNSDAIRRAYYDLVKGKSKCEMKDVTDAIILDLRLNTPSRFDKKLNIPKMNKPDSNTRNKRQECQTMFENFDKKTNQLFNLLSTVLKSHKEMNSGVARNLL